MYITKVAMWPIETVYSNCFFVDVEGKGDF